MSLLKKLSAYGSKPAINDTKRKLTYAQLYRASLALASQIQMKLRQAKKWPIEQPRVMYVTNRDVLTPMAQLAAWHLNGICIPVNSSCKIDEIEFFLRDSKADVVVCHNDFYKKMKQVQDVHNIPVHSMKDAQVDLTCKSLLQNRAAVLPAKQDAMIIYTAEDTASPKGVVHTHGSLEAMMTTTQEAWQWTEQDHIMNILPLDHIHGIVNVLTTSLWCGAQCYMIPKFDDRKVWDILLDQQDGVYPTLFMGVPSLYKTLIDYYDEYDMINKKKWTDYKDEKKKKAAMRQQEKFIKQCMKSYRLMVSRSTALPEEHFQRWKEITGLTLLEQYGMNEMGMAVSNSYADPDSRIPGHIGQAMPGVETALLNMETGQVHNDPDVESELLIQSTSMFNRYLDKAEATEECFTTDANGNKWFKTGDAAILSGEHNSYKIMRRLSQN